MTRRRVLSETDGEDGVSAVSDSENSQQDASDGSELLDTQEEAFNNYSDFKESGSERKKPPTLPPRKKETAVKSSKISAQTPWDKMYSDFQKMAQERNISKQQITMGLYLVGGLVAYMLVNSLLFGSSRRPFMHTDLLDCSAVSGSEQNMVECKSPDGYSLQVIKSSENSVLIEIAASKSGSSFGLFSALFTLIKYMIYIGLGLTIGVFIMTDEGHKRWKLVKQKYMELSKEIQKNIESKLKGKSSPVVRRGRQTAVSESESESESDGSESG